MRIQEALDAWLREHQPEGFSPTKAESQALDKLLTRRTAAGAKKDMKAWQAVHLEILRSASRWFERYRHENP